MTAPLAAGTRVTATVWGVPSAGTVTRITPTVVMVRFDGATVERWMHRDSLTVVPSDFYPINAERA